MPGSYFSELQENGYNVCFTTASVLFTLQPSQFLTSEPSTEPLSPLEANSLSLPHSTLGPYDFDHSGEPPRVGSGRVPCLLAVLEDRLECARAQNPFPCENRAVHQCEGHSPSLSLDAEQVGQIPSSLGQILHVTLHGALKGHSGTPQVHHSRSRPSVSLSCLTSSASQDPDHKAK